MRAIFVGPEKTGTSWIHNYLLWHGELFQPDHAKETYFFDRYYDRGLPWYEKQFRGAVADRVEVAPSYFRDPLAPQRIKDAYQSTQIVITLRKPVDRVISMYHHLVANGWIDQPFRQAFQSDDRLKSSSLYAHHIERWRTFFPADQVHLVQYERLKDAPADFAKQLNQILGIGARPVPDDVYEYRVNARRSARSPRLAKLSRHAIRLLLRVGAYRMINLARRSGIRRLLWKSDTESSELITDEDRMEVSSSLMQDMIRLLQTEGINYVASLTASAESSEMVT